ncbi:hypothetical protein GDN83_05275 [Gordonia jinghuaiqii]|uniref:Asp23/Gls24 family envelope stress response protein n=1 Tax=Gordonia jinghuaiqii TaxID=2758710 RepID=A0A7D7LUL7_9ACTN|nr:hypothetical protein [Gordonia jinghuaiqii]MCR5977159.1 hypothetical protein [Gordonia jinghuaiqii]QMT00238.1 hypothetical protein H1R19_15050 [Gordonia jinghuaiqii]
MTADFPSARPDGSDPPELAEALAAAVLAVPGVTELHAGMFGEVATYLPGHRVAGVSLSDQHGEIHIVASLSYDLQAVAAAVRDTAEKIAARPISVTVEDISTDFTPAPKEGGAQ